MLGGPTFVAGWSDALALLGAVAQTVMMLVLLLIQARPGPQLCAVPTSHRAVRPPSPMRPRPSHSHCWRRKWYKSSEHNEISMK